VLHTTPFAVILPFPSDIILPPENAVEEEIEVTGTVVKEGGFAGVVKEI
jgi:hypothetical protein